MGEEICETCRWWGHRGDEQGDCRRYPPQFNSASAALRAKERPGYDAIQLGCEERHPFMFTQPVTFYDDFCGEWQAKRVPLPVVEPEGNP